MYVSNDYLISFITHLQENLCLKIQTQLKQIKISLNIHIKQIKSPRLQIVGRHNEIRIIIPNQYMTSLLKIQSKCRFCFLSLKFEVVRQTQYFGINKFESYYFYKVTVQFNASFLRLKRQC